MAKSLIIVESPAKIKTLKNILGPGYRIEASMGHVRDLPKSKLGVEVENDFTPQYVAIPDRKDIIKKLKAAADEADVVYLASDPDREGEAIAWHLEQSLKLKSPKRIQFNEITKQAVLHALEEPREINSDLVNAQQARRVLDRLVGYKLSPLLWKKVKRNLSAGRVQSVAVRMICDREREIQAFVPEEYWLVTAKLTPLDKLDPFEAKLIQKNGAKLELHTEDDTNRVFADLKDAEYKVSKISRREQRRSPSAPFITSTLQQEASRKLGYTAKRTMRLAQQLYEGLDLGEHGTAGLITYMRTDSTRIANEARDEAKEFILNTYGQDYLPAKPNIYTKKGAQDAHEAIRPTSVMRRPEMVSKYLDPSQLRLYKLIWQRFVASQMAQAIFDVVTVDVSARDYLFRAAGSTPKFQGFIAVYSEGKDDQKVTDEERPPLPVLKEDEALRLIELLPDQKFTEPPPRYSEATLVKALEENGIGRPSTYASIISTIQDRAYVNLEEKRFVPTELGFAVTDLLVKSFPDILDVKFTASVETRLDNVEEGKLNWVKLLKEFYPPFERALITAQEKMERVKIAPKESDEVCPNCGKKMFIRESRYGQFLGCSGYPDCKTTMSLAKKLNVACPICKQGQIVEKMSKKRRVFYGCDKYPECSYVSWDKPLEKLCPKCNSNLSERNYKGRPIGVKCISANCDYQESYSKKSAKDEDEQALAS
ncbi:MAG: type I DNA topoisomerase [Armatimonadota bacterium]|nr:type I DNA topoisomerase [Armatimonadota bacterium]